MTSGVQLVNVAGSIGGVAQSASNLASLLGANSGWTPKLLKGSWDGFPFAVESTRTNGGRRYAIHEYPFREDSWIEDMGKLPSRLELTGYLVEDSLIYQGGPVIDQKNRLYARLIGDPTPKTLVHPTFGTQPNMVCIAAEFSEEREAGRVIEMRLTLMKAGMRVFPVAKTTGAAIPPLAQLGFVATLLNYVAKVASIVQTGAAIIQTAISTAVGWYQFVVTAIADVKAIVGAVSTLSGNFGRLFGGSNSSFTGQANPLARPTATVSDLLAGASLARTAVLKAGVALQLAAANPNDSATLGAAAQTLVTALAATASDPADAVRLITSLAQYYPQAVMTPGPFGTAMQVMQDAVSALLRRAALTQLALTLTTYQPSSQTDANVVMTQAVAVFDAEITIAGDAGDDDTYLALRALRQAVVADLAARGADLSVIAAFHVQNSLPSLALALRLYRDPTREPGLTQQIAPRHPAFCPLAFDALAS